MERNQIPYFSKNCSIPRTTVLSLDNGDTITNLYDIVNTFNSYFASVAETSKKSMKYSSKHFSECLSNETSSAIFLQPTDKEEIANIISPSRILFFLKMKFRSNCQIYSTSLSRMVLFLRYSKLQK